MKSSIVAAAAVALTAGTLGGSAQAATVFTDNFNTYPVMLNWVPPANWTAGSGPLGGTVDLIGMTTDGPLFNLFPGNGGYVDLDGSSGADIQSVNDHVFRRRLLHSYFRSRRKCAERRI